MPLLVDVDETVDHETHTRRPKPPRSLFISYRGLIYRLSDGTVGQNDLDTALFYFGCTKEHAANAQNEQLRQLVSDEQHAQEVHERLRRAIALAERENRVAWRDPAGSNRYVELNLLLMTHHYRPVPAEAQPEPTYDATGYASVKREVERLNPRLKVVF